MTLEKSLKMNLSTSYDGIDKKSPTIMLHLLANKNILTLTNLLTQSVYVYVAQM